MKLLKPILLLALVFLAGIGVGVVGSRVAIRRYVVQAAGRPDFLPMRIEREMNRRMQLDAQQRLAIHEVLVRSESDLRNLRLEFLPRRRAIINRSRSDLAALLTPEQRKKLEEMMRPNQMWWLP